MIKGIGVDIVEIERIVTLSRKQPKFVDRILTNKEKDEYISLSNDRRGEFLSGRFAAKEAYAKAEGTGIGSRLSFLDIEIMKDSIGKPYIVKPQMEGVHLSISHSKEYAVAQVIIEK
ncbi:holo-ACP synthase [Rossellomorea sp. BNER]|uniref:holo-ACP synthase n=1 Tax=Rossellomorea sp. BNER TaxID=2962031 RepID=UPI003AF243C5|nr:holo-ACP synthase [Rossellomorea sp. BNER]